MRIAVAGMMHETNTFTSLRTGMADFTKAAGAEVHAVERWRGSVFAGILEMLASRGAEPVPIYFARALPSGLVDAETLRTFVARIVAGIVGAGPFDGICLGLHGSMCAEGCDDPEGELLERLREAVGDDVPIVCALDMHATVTQRMIDLANGYAAYRTAPHIDEYETGARAARLLLTALGSRERLVTVWSPIPILIAGEQTETDVSPTKELIEALYAEDGVPGVLETSYLLGFPWADSPHGGAAAVASGFESSRSALIAAADRLADRFWKQRHAFDFSTEALPLAEALRQASEDKRRPVVVSDSGDNPTAGASQDLAVALEAMLAAGMRRSLVAAIYDPASVAACQAAGEGAPVELRLGRLDPYRRDPATPLPLAVTVARIGSVKDVEYAAVATEAGPEGITVLLCAKRTAVYDPSVLTALGLDPGSFDVIVVKSGYLSPAFRSLAGRAILALTPGDTNELLAGLPYRRVKRPIYPLDQM